MFFEYKGFKTLVEMQPNYIAFNYSCPQDCTDEVPCEGLDNHAHFKNFGFSMLTLFRVSTGDNWNGILKVLYLKLCLFYHFD